MDKKIIRQAMIKQRLALNEEEYQSYSLKIIESLLASSFFNKEKPLGIYMTIRHEVDTLYLIRNLLEMGVRIALPKIEEDGMHFYYIDSLERLVLGTFGVMEPQGDHLAKDLSTLIVPLVAFNEKKERIGYGKGYYDRYIAQYHPQTIGIAFDFQKQEFVGETHDQPLDYIITEKRIYE